MLDQVAVLNRIAKILEQGDKPAFLQTSGGQLVILVTGLILGAIFTYVISKRLQKEELKRTERKETKRRDQQRSLFVSLIGDEITLRWNHVILRTLLPFLNKYSIKNVSALCNMRFEPEDLYVFYQCANDIALTTVFDDNAVVSNVIYVYILAKDLSDVQTELCSCYDNYKSFEANKASAKQDDAQFDGIEIESKLKERWEYLKGIVTKMDSQMLKIFARIEKEYGEYIESSGFMREPKNDFPEIKRRLEDAARKRLSAVPSNPEPAAS